eukprot:jgi/Phyca11/107719/e_gw1.14.770.1
MGRTLDFFPTLFRSADRIINMNKVRDWWDKRKMTIAKLEDPQQRKYARARQRIRHHDHWQWLYPKLLAEFQRLRRADCKMSTSLISEIAGVLIEDSEHIIYNTRFTVKGKPFTSMITPRRVQDFLERNNIVYRRHKGKKQVNEEKQIEIDRSIAVHLGRLKRHFEEGTLDPNQQYNTDEVIL